MKRITLVTAASLLLSAVGFPMQALAADNNNFCDIAQGNGSAATPWLVATQADLQEIGESDCGALMATTQNYRLIADIALTGAWTPARLHSNEPLTLDGNGHTISNLNFSSVLDSMGLFRSVLRGTVKDLKITGSSITGGNFVGALAGLVSNSTIRNVSVDMTGNITGQQDVGGVIGRASGGSSLTNLSVKAATVVGTAYAGGVVGQLDNSNASKLAAFTDTNFSNIGGGVIGSVYTTSNVVLDGLWASGTIKAGQYTGGLVGYIFGFAGTPITVSISNSGVRGSIQAQGNTTPAMFIGEVGNHVTTVTYNANYVDATVFRNASTTPTSVATVSAHNNQGTVVNNGNLFDLGEGWTATAGHATGGDLNSPTFVFPQSWVVEKPGPTGLPVRFTRPWVIDPDQSTPWNQGYPMPNAAYNEGLFGGVSISAPLMSAVAGNGKVTFTLMPALYNGGFRITGYSLIRSGTIIDFSRVTIGDSHVYEVTGLTDGQLYTFEYAARFLAGSTPLYGMPSEVVIQVGIPCPAGQFSQTGYGTCTQAPAGRFIATTGATAAVDCPAGTFQPNAGSSACLPAQPGFFVANAGSAAQDPCPAGTTSLAANATACTVIASANTEYSGPQITSSGVAARAGSTVNLLGTGLDAVTGASIDGVVAEVVSKTSTSITIRIPALTAGVKDLVLTSGSGTLTIQGVFRVVSGEEITTQTGAVSIKRIGNRVRLFVSDAVGMGKIQFMVNGREIGWVRAVDATNPKLRVTAGTHYFVRSHALAAGKNAIEIYVDGERQKRVAYTR